MLNNHRIKLPVVQALLWREICLDLGIYAVIDTAFSSKDRYTILTRCTDSDRQAAWELFYEKFNTLVK
jgi:hypothetical protein